MSREQVRDYAALGVFLLWIGGVCMILTGIWLPSWQWAATGALAIGLGVVGALVANE
jgi:membrane protein implicated in regulation of membrane protease activity